MVVVEAVVVEAVVLVLGSVVVVLVDGSTTEDCVAELAGSTVVDDPAPLPHAATARATTVRMIGIGRPTGEMVTFVNAGPLIALATTSVAPTVGLCQRPNTHLGRWFADLEEVAAIVIFGLVVKCHAPR